MAQEFTFTVEQSRAAEFPMDMLRYDSALPATIEDAALIERLNRRDQIEDLPTRVSIKLITTSRHSPTFKRWSSFDVQVTDISDTAPPWKLYELSEVLRRPAPREPAEPFVPIGPWTRRYTHGVGWSIDEPLDGPPEGICRRIASSIGNEREASLLQAAPRMLEALKEARWVISNMAAALTAQGIESTLTDPLPMIDAAIADALDQKVAPSAAVVTPS